MTTLVMNKIVNPLQGFGKGIWNFFEVVGYARAGAELSRLGLYKEAKACMMKVKALKQAK